MLIHIRGTSGSGKSTIVRKVMKELGKWEPITVKGRRRPLYYRNVKRPDVIVLGHYEGIDCGGCDTIGSAPQVYKAIKSILTYGVAISEGLLWSEDVIWTQRLEQAGEKSVVYLLKTTQDNCLKRVIGRRGGTQGNMERVVRKLSVRVGTIQRAYDRLLASGIECYTISDKIAHRVILNRILKHVTRSA